jgi:hypothetical protein
LSWLANARHQVKRGHCYSLKQAFIHMVKPLHRLVQFRPDQFGSEVFALHGGWPEQTLWDVADIVRLVEE